MIKSAFWVTAVAERKGRGGSWREGHLDRIPKCFMAAMEGKGMPAGQIARRGGEGGTFHERKEKKRYGKGGKAPFFLSFFLSPFFYYSFCRTCWVPLAGFFPQTEKVKREKGLER